MTFEKLTQTARRARQVAGIANAAHKAATASDSTREAAQRALAERMADARGIPLKIGQLMGTLTKGDAFVDLARGVPPQPIAVIRPAVEAALGQPLESVFAEFDDIGIAASLGQVHKARLHTGAQVAVKVRYPEIAGAVDAELRLARLVPGLGPVRKWGFNLDEYKNLLHDTLKEELDYRGELERQLQFRATVNVNGLVTPILYPELSSETILVQSWEDGVTLDEAAHWSDERRRHLAVILMCTVFQGLFAHGLVHGDPHNGNYRFRIDTDGKPEVVLMDYGCVLAVPLEARRALLKLVLGAIEDDETDPLLCFHAMGFDAAKLQPIRSVLPALTKVLVEPFTTPYAFSIHHWDLQERVDTLLGELKWWFRAAGPPKVLLMMRALHGLIMQLEALQINLPWMAVFKRIVPPDCCSEARAAVLPPLPAGVDDVAMGFSALAQYLKVQVLENGHQIAAVTLPAAQVTLLESIIPEDVLSKLHAASIDVAGIKARACATGIVPQALFEHTDETRTYRVWLE